MKSKALYISVYILGLSLCTVPACIAVLDRFTFWKTEQRVSAIVILLLALCCIPLWRQIRNAIKMFAENPSAWGVWLLLTLVLWVFNAIAEDMLAVCYIALPSSIVGGLMMGFAHKKLKQED